jgi:hypothetical protein
MNKATAGIATVTFGALALTGCGGGSQGNSAHVKLMPVTMDASGAVAHAQALQHEQAVAKAQAAAHAKVVKAQAHARALAHQRAVVHAQAIARQARVDAARAQRRAARHAQALADAQAARKAKATKHTRKAPPGRAVCRLAPDSSTFYPAECGPGAGNNPGCGDLSVPQGHNWNCSNYQGVLDPRNDKRQTVPGNAPWSTARCATAVMGDYNAHCK